MNFEEDVLKHATKCKYKVELLRIFVIISFTNTVRHSVNDSTSKGLVISLFSEFRSCLPQSLNIYSVVRAVVIQYDCV